jgi:hypothetical protein
VLGEHPFVDVGDGLAPAIQELHGVVAAGDLWHRDDQAALLVDGDPRLRVRDVEIRIRPVDFARLAVYQHVPLEAFLEVELLLAQDEQAAEETDVAVADLGLRERW